MAEVTAYDLFLAAFKNCVTNIINSLPPNVDPTDVTTTSAIKVITSQLNGDYKRLEYVITTIQVRVCEDAAWASGTAVSIYQLLAASIDPKFPTPDTEIEAATRAVLVRRQIMQVFLAQLYQTMTKPKWSRGLIAYLGQTCTVHNITSMKPYITLHILDNILESESLTDNDNFDIFLGFLMRAGPFLDSTGNQDKLKARVHELKETSKTLRTKE